MKKNFCYLLRSDIFLKYYLLVFICLQPILELDLYLTRFYSDIHTIAISTIVRILGIVFLAFLCFLKSQKKLLNFILWFVYGLIFVIYVYFHFKYSRSISVKLPASYVWKGSYELKYILFLILPLILCYATSKIKINKHEFNISLAFISFFICINIFITNIILTSYGAYGGITYQNIFTWFSNIYDEYTPRELTSIGFYFAANPLSGLFFMLLPLLLKAVYEEKNKIIFGIVSIIQILVMFMLGTKVAGYGVVIALVATLFIYLFFVFRKYLVFKRNYVVFLVMLTIVSSIIVPFSPAHVNASFNYENERSFASNERNLLASLNELKKLDEIQFKYALIYQLENIYLYYITFPREYYDYYYPYQYDPEFYFDVLSLPFEQRKGGRQFQKYFTQRKFNEMNNTEKMFGLGYSRMSNGGIVLEQDFKRQYYILGPFGMIVTVSYYLFLWIFTAIILIINFFNKHKLNFETATLFLSYSLAMFSAYFSGHILDEPIVSLVLGFVLGRFIYLILRKEYEVCD